MNYERCKGFIYEIQEGDTLYLLSRRFSIPLVELMRANPYADVYQLKVGDTLCIPDFPRPPMGRPPMGGTPCSGCKPPCGNCKPPMGGMTPPSGGMTPPNGEMTPPSGEMTPPSGEMTPPNGGMTPPSGEMTPPSGGMTPPSEGMTPPSGEMTPPSGDTRPPMGRPPMGNQPCGNCRPPMEKPPCGNCRPPMEKPPCGSCKPMKPWSPEHMDGVRPWGMESDGDEGHGMDDKVNNGRNIIKYVVQENDSLGNLLSDFEIEMEEFLKLNDVNRIYLKLGTVILLKDKQ